MTKTHHLIAEDAHAGMRLDRWLATELPELSRSRLQTLIRDGQVSAGETLREPRTPVKPGTTYRVIVPAATDGDLQGEDIPLDVLFEDAHLIVIAKPPGLVVHPSAGHAKGTLVHALLAHCGDSLSGIGGIKRPGIVHRLDKETSGVMVVAKSDAAHAGLAEQFRSHGRDGRLRREYIALVWGVPVRPTGTIDQALARSQHNRTKIAAVAPEAGREAITHFKREAIFNDRDGASLGSLLRLQLETGRTHQIRVHLAHIGHPVLGDPVYGPGFKTRTSRLPDEARSLADDFSRQALHAETLGFEHPLSGKPLAFSSPPPDDMARLIKALRGNSNLQNEASGKPGRKAPTKRSSAPKRAPK